MKYTQLEIPGLWLIEPEVIGTPNETVVETFRAEDFRKHITAATFVQELNFRLARGFLMGLRYQPGRPQGKLVRAASGRVTYVAVDLRKSSRFFGRWVKVILSAENHRILWVPPGFADGCYVVSPDAELACKHTEYRYNEGELSIKWNDPDLDIQWDLLPGIPGLPATPPMLSEKDEQGVFFENASYFA